MLQFLIDTLLRASDLALVALGLSMVYGLVKFPNIAHVQYAMLGAYLSFGLRDAGLTLVPAIAVACVLTGALTLLLHLLVFRRLLRSGPAITMIGSLAVAMLIVAVMQGVAGSFPRMFNLPVTAPWRLSGAMLTPLQATTLSVSLLVLTVFCIVLFHTRMGRALRALSSNAPLAAASGLNAEGLTRGVAFVSGAVAALGGAMLALSSGAHINLGHDLLLPVFAAAILGGLGNPIGAVAGALLIALTETAVTNINFGPLLGWFGGGDAMAFMPVSYISAASFLILLLALLFKPYGLFDREVRRV
ncbi:amino acid/amide ABC transporter membrane protein 1, HAAT family (TC 3.A.1.4.-) [Roseateles sp. YR242]|uniref:branched-chain amino acid ABC transporter permease n=1 Tax=Roseateles sp. YR242 TaxID=1855305 RepID=UPI0008C5D6AE|nr:branched-chain amino acid ABC transporter permease [Roseateles sp. YR242]SEK83626.1 amino acid/amide ABC transporter membrane protein 1, HAAT family (TC 3.A.1.4.-) [Roseateles sp. YR242]